jgi:hypothetical protein
VDRQRSEGRTLVVGVLVVGGITAALVLAGAGRFDQCGLPLPNSGPAFNQDGSSRIFYWFAAGCAATPFAVLAVLRRRHLDILIWLALVALFTWIGTLLVGQVNTHRFGC